MTTSLNSAQIVLQVFQTAIADLVGENLPDICKLNNEENEIVKESRRLLALNRKVNTLSLLFDQIKLPDGKGQKKIIMFRSIRLSVILKAIQIFLIRSQITQVKKIYKNIKLVLPLKLKLI